jgi:L,D-peptidoglycan transpeptidase YkuD (ErfK/YbiS/YcfS/YnhG family)
VTGVAVLLLITCFGGTAGPADPAVSDVSGRPGGPDAPPASAPVTAPVTAPAAFPATVPVPTTVPTTARPTAPAAAAVPLSRNAPGCAVPASVHAAQVVLVRHKGTRAVVTACARRSTGGYRLVLGSFHGWVGYRGVAPAGRKREGDGRTPGGVFRLRGGFGTASNPGLRLGWLRVGAADVWVDDSAASLYNTHQRLPARGRWASAERLRQRAYRYAQVIGYNEARTPGRGSAIFFHVSTGGPTAGCVSLPTSALLEVMRWERPGAVIVIR